MKILFLIKWGASFSFHDWETFLQGTFIYYEANYSKCPDFGEGMGSVQFSDMFN